MVVTISRCRPRVRTGLASSLSCCAIDLQGTKSAIRRGLSGTYRTPRANEQTKDFVHRYPESRYPLRARGVNSNVIVIGSSNQKLLTDMSSRIEYASSPCMWHESDELMKHVTAPVRDRPSDIAAWRRWQRRRQIDARCAISAERRSEISAQIAERLVQSLGTVTGRCVSFYWPIRGEPDLRPLIPRIIELGGMCALPVVVMQGQPLVFHSWQPGERLKRGVWNIPVPASGREIEPDIVVAPVVAYDQANFRLGYGGGYFDRTLASLSGRPRVFGVGFACAEIATIHPQPHDVAMDVIVTDKRQFQR